MKKLFVLLLFLICTSNSNLFSQDDELDNFSFETEPLKSESTQYFAVGAGYNFNFLMMNYDEVNKYVVDKLRLDKFKGVFTIHGVQGFTGLVVIPNTRLGFFGMTGSKEVSKENSELNTKMTSELIVSVNGFSLDYGIVPFKGFAILPGFNFGWGNYTLETIESPTKLDWGKIDKINIDSAKMNRINNKFMFIQPQLSFEYAVTNFAMLRANVNYNLTFDNPLADKSWTFNKEAEIKNPPSKLNSNGLGIQIGIYLGLFNY